MAKKQRPEYEALAQKIASGELTRKQASEIAQEQTGLSASTFLVWLSQQKLDLPHGSAGRSKLDPDKVKAYDQALAEVLTTAQTPEIVADKYGVSRGYLRKLVKQEKERKEPQPTPLAGSVDADELRQALALIDHLKQDPDKAIRLAHLAQALL